MVALHLIHCYPFHAISLCFDTLLSPFPIPVGAQALCPYRPEAEFPPGRRPYAPMGRRPRSNTFGPYFSAFPPGRRPLLPLQAGGRIPTSRRGVGPMLPLWAGGQILLYAPCSMLYALCSMHYAPCSMPSLPPQPTTRNPQPATRVRS